MITDELRIYDAFDDVTGGVDGALSTLLLPRNRTAKLVNGTVRGGVIGTRPSYAAVPLTFENETARAYFERFQIQGGKYYWHPTTDGLLISSIGGRIFSTDILGRCKDITPVSGPNSSKLPLAWMEFVDPYFVIQNGQDKAIILEGLASRRADPDKVIDGPTGPIPAPEVPTGTVMGFGLNRLVVANYDRTGFVVGDQAGGSTTVLTFAQSEYLNEAPGFAMPRQLGKIVAITFLAQADTAAGIGACLIIGSRGILAMDLSVPRTDWLDTDLSRVVLLETGGVGASAIVQANGDLFFRSQQGGLRTLRMARSEQSGWGKTPISREVSDYLSNDSPALLQFCQMARFENRMFCTTAPQLVEGHVNHLGMVVMNFDLISSLSGNSAPAWEGVWTGITPTVLSTGLYDEEERMLALCHDKDGINRIYEIRREETYDLSTVPIPSVLQTRALAFESPYALKELVGADFWITDILGPTEFVLKWRPTGYSEWTEWHRWTMCGDQTAPGASCAAGDCVVLGSMPRARSRLIMPRPPKACAIDGSHQELAFGYAFEFRIEWTGRAKISRFRAHAHKLSEQSLGSCPEEQDTDCGTVQVCPTDDFSYNLALDSVGCADATIFSATLETNPQTIDFRPWHTAIVRGATWVIEGIDGLVAHPYYKGAITGNRMDNLPDFVTGSHPGIRLVTYCVDPYGEGGNDFPGSGPTGPSGT